MRHGLLQRMVPVTLRRVLVIGFVLLTALRLVLAARTELLPEEAYYWTYTQHPAWSYYDHPPMVAWIIHIGTRLLGHTEAGVRVVNLVLAALGCWLLVSTTRRWFDEAAAIWAGLLFMLTPIFAGAAFMVTPDGPLLFFWLLTLYAITRALAGRNGAGDWERHPHPDPLPHTTAASRGLGSPPAGEGKLLSPVGGGEDTGEGVGGIGWWLLAGIGFGGALLSKYYGLLLAPSLLLFLLMSPRYRSWLRRPQPWLALLVALALFSPVIWWNSQNQWASFAFQTSRTSTAAKHGNPFLQFAQFWLVLVAILTPATFVLLAAAAIRAIRQGWRGDRFDHWNFVVAFGLPLLALFAYASLKTEVRLNWTAPAFLSLCLGGGALLAEAGRRWRIAVWSTVVLCVLAMAVGHIVLLVRGPKFMRYAQAGGWRQLTRQVELTRSALAQTTGQRPFILGTDKYNLAAELSFYTQAPAECVNSYALGEQGLGFRYWTRLEDFVGRPAVALLTNTRPDNLARLRTRFASVDTPQIVRLFAHGRLVRELYLVNCYGYRVGAN